MAAMRAVIWVFPFFTVVTYNRRALFTESLARECLHAASDKTRRRTPFEDVALCLLPDHMHGVWKLPEDDGDFSLRWARIKAGFTRRYLGAGGIGGIKGLRSKNRT